MNTYINTYLETLNIFLYVVIDMIGVNAVTMCYSVVQKVLIKSLI